MKLQVKKEFEYDPIGSHQRIDPYTIAFVYPKEGKPFIVKGGLKNVDPYLSTFALTMPCFVHRSYWKEGKSRCTYEVLGLNSLLGIFFRHGWPQENKKIYAWESDSGEPKIVKNVRNVFRYRMYVYDVNGQKLVKTFRKIPRQWIKEFDEFCP